MFPFPPLILSVAGHLLEVGWWVSRPGTPPREEEACGEALGLGGGGPGAGVRVGVLHGDGWVLAEACQPGGPSSHMWGRHNHPFGNRL